MESITNTELLILFGQAIIGVGVIVRFYFFKTHQQLALKQGEAKS